jgi:hypothetical protein
MAADGAASTATFCESLAAQPAAFCTVTPRPTGPDDPAVKATFLVPAPLVNVPFVIVQAYEAPAPPSTTDALPAAPTHRAAGAVMVADGAALIVTLAEALAPHPAPLSTVIPRETLPEGPGMKAMLRVPAPEVMLPLVIVQE